MNCEWIRIWKKAVVAHFNVLHRHPEENENKQILQDLGYA
jgi:hypothetical protein